MTASRPRMTRWVPRQCGNTTMRNQNGSGNRLTNRKSVSNVPTVASPQSGQPFSPDGDVAVVEAAHRPEAAIPGVQHLTDRVLAKVAQAAQQVCFQGRGHLARIAVGSAERFGDHVV